MMELFETLKPASNEAVGVVERFNENHCDAEDVTGLCITSTPAQPGGRSCTSNDAAMADVDLVDALSGCMENQADADQLVAGLLEMEDELKALTDDDASSFLQFPSILQEIFGGESPSDQASSYNEATSVIPPSISEEYLHAPHSGSENNIMDHQAMIAQHPLLPLISSILQKCTCQMDEPLNASECALLDSFKSRSEMDAFMRDAVSQAIQLSKDKNNIGGLMQSIDNEGSYFTSEMSTFCQNLLQSDTVQTSDSSKQIQLKTSQLPSHQNPPKDKLAKENKQKLKPELGKKRVRLSQQNTQILREWLLEHADNPFPTDSEKDMLCLRTGLTLSKLTTWFVNSRRRILAPLGLKNYHKEMK